MRYFYRIDKQGNPIPGTLARLKAKPINGSWKEAYNDCCPTCLPIESLPFDTTSEIQDGEIPGNCTLHFVLKIHGVDVGTLIKSESSLIADFINDINTAYTGFGTFTFNDENDTIVFKPVDCCVDWELVTYAIC